MGGKKGRGRKSSRGLGYTASFRARALGITSTEKPLPSFGGMYTGQEFRPLIISPERKARETRSKLSKQKSIKTPRAFDFNPPIALGSIGFKPKSTPKKGKKKKKKGKKANAFGSFNFKPFMG